MNQPSPAGPPEWLNETPLPLKLRVVDYVAFGDPIATATIAGLTIATDRLG